MPAVEEQVQDMQKAIKELTDKFHDHYNADIRVDERSKSNTKRLDEVDEQMKENNSLISAIKELAVETKYMRSDLNETMQRLKQLESQDGETWRRFKWLIIATVAGVILGTVASKMGLV